MAAAYVRRNRSISLTARRELAVHLCPFRSGLLDHGPYPPAPARYARLCGRSKARAFPATRSCKSSRDLHDYGRQASLPCTPSVCFSLDRKILTAATGDQAGSNHSLPVPPSTYGGLVPRPGRRDGCPVGSSRHRAPVQGMASIAAPPRLSSDTFTREGSW
jgi:hypothetical protein